MMSTRVLKIQSWKEKKVSIVFDDMIADVTSNKKLYPVVTELFIKGRKLPGTKRFNIRKNIFACLFSVHNIISLSRHEQVCLMSIKHTCS